MEKSFFYELIKDLFPNITEKIVAEKLGNPMYSFMDNLDEEFTLNGTFQVITGQNVTTKIDIISKDSPLPLKNRPAIRTAQGELPKLGGKKKFNETQLMNARTMLLTPNVPKLSIIRNILDDAKNLTNGVFETNEELFLQGLSNGVCKVEDKKNVGTAIRLDYGFLPANKNGVPVVWSGPTAKPITDVRNLLNKAKNDGVVLERMWLDDKTFANILKSDEAKQAVIGLTGVAFNVVSESKLKEYFKTEFGLDIIVVTRVIKSEIDGVVTSDKPWKENMVTFTTNGKLGKLYYSRVIEADAKNECAIYSEPNAYILAKKWRTIDPLAELTGVEAMCLPVITDVENIYQIDTNEVQA